MPYIQTVKAVIADSILPQAQNTDRNAVFPRNAISAFGKTGIMVLFLQKMWVAWA